VLQKGRRARRTRVESSGKRGKAIFGAERAPKYWKKGKKANNVKKALPPKGGLRRVQDENGGKTLSIWEEKRCSGGVLTKKKKKGGNFIKKKKKTELRGLVY